MALRPGVLDEEAAAVVRVARVLALELGVGEAGLDGLRHAEGLVVGTARVSQCKPHQHSKDKGESERESGREKEASKQSNTNFQAIVTYVCLPTCLPCCL